MRLSWYGPHYAIRLWPDPFINIPYWRHRIIVIGIGRCSRKGVYHPRQPCCFLLKLRYCCGRI